MSYQDDYIKRLLQKIGEVLARALGLGKAGNFDQSVEVLEQGVGAELGMPFAMLLRLENKSLVTMLGDEKAGAFADALRTRSVLFEIAGRSEEARASAAHADAIDALRRPATGRVE